MKLAVCATNEEGAVENKVQFAADLQNHINSFNLTQKLTPSSYQGNVKVHSHFISPAITAEGVLALLKKYESKHSPVAIIETSPTVGSSATVYRYLEKMYFLNDTNTGVICTNDSFTESAQRLSAIANYQFLDILSGSRWARTSTTLGGFS